MQGIPFVFILWHSTYHTVLKTKDNLSSIWYYYDLIFLKRLIIIYIKKSNKKRNYVCIFFPPFSSGVISDILFLNHKNQFLQKIM